MIDIWKYTWFKTKNFVKAFFDIKTENDWKNFLDKLWQFERIFIIWWWTNLLLSKSYYEDEVFVRFFISWIKQVDTYLFEVKWWESLNKFILYLNNLWFSQLNPLYWLPGTVGGAVVGNAWSFWISIWDFVKEVKVFDLNIKKYKIFTQDDLKFSYRYSILKWKNDVIVVEAMFDLTQGLQEDNQNMKDISYYLKRRLQHQPRWNTCWSFFKNIKREMSKDDGRWYQKMIENIKTWLSAEDIVQLKIFIENWMIPAGWLIDKAWLKWFDIGWVKISEKHANFIVNYNNDDSNKILKLAEIVKEKVYNKFGVLLEEEVVIF